MNNMPDPAHDELAFAVANGNVKNQQDLLLFVQKKGWDVLRTGEDFITIKVSGGRRFRFRYQMDDVAYVGWVYALIATDADERACYIGSTGDLIRRMDEHRAMATRFRRSGRTSAEFFYWANQRHATVKVVILEEVRGRSALSLSETTWTETARLAGWILPGVQRWGAKSRRVVATSSAIRGNVSGKTRSEDLAFHSAIDLFSAKPAESHRET